MGFSASFKYVVLLWLICLWSNAPAQLIWSPIYVSGNSQIDLWTQEAKGCSCPWDRSNQQCACCVSDGGCHCGKSAPNRCTQCGLEQHCYHLCNITIQSSELKVKSGKTFGQIKSPSLEGPDMCSYTFIPSSNQRVEVQIYRLVNAGKYNGTSCVGGFLQLISGPEPQYNPTDNQICGSNERYSPPVVFFADDGLATLLFQVTEKTSRSLFLAYFSFTENNNTEGLGYQPQGGFRLQNTDCDWLYRDVNCTKAPLCVLASPSYPGVYPPHRQCKYHIISSNENVQVRISFTALLLPPNCRTDYIAIYQGSTTSSPLLATLCGTQRKTFEYSGLNLLIEFSSGPQKPPFEYNGFVANLKFFNKIQTTETPTTTTTTTTPTPTTLPTKITVVNETNDVSGCDILISGNNTRSGHFDTREHEWFPVCRLVFQGRITDVVQVSFFNYRLRSPSCQSIIEVLDNSVANKRSVMERICSPTMKQEKDKAGANELKKFLSTGNSLVVTLKRTIAPLATKDAEFLAGAYYFHDEELSGTMEPTGLCDVKFNGSPLAGTIDNPGTQHFYWNIDGPLTCRQQFVPAANQSVTIKVQSIEKMTSDPVCFTQCGDFGCQCVTNTSIRYVDHFMIVAENNLSIVCLCGSFHKDGLPVSVRSWGPLTVVYSVAQYVWSKSGFAFQATYNFDTDGICSGHIFRIHSGEITIKNLSRPNYLNHFYHQSCAWTLHSNVERLLELFIISNQNRPCTAWNISVYEYMNDPKNQNLGDLLQVFCSKDNYIHKLFPHKPTVVVRLFTLSRTLPQFRIRWKSQVARAKTGLTAPTPVPAATAFTPATSQSLGFLFQVLILARIAFMLVRFT